MRLDPEQFDDYAELLLWMRRRHEVDKGSQRRRPCNAADGGSGGNLMAIDAFVESGIIHRENACRAVDSVLGGQGGGFLPEVFRERRAWWMAVTPLGQARAEGEELGRDRSFGTGHA